MGSVESIFLLGQPRMVLWKPEFSPCNLCCLAVQPQTSAVSPWELSFHICKVSLETRAVQPSAQDWEAWSGRRRWDIMNLGTSDLTLSPGCAGRNSASGAMRRRHSTPSSSPHSRKSRLQGACRKPRKKKLTGFSGTSEAGQEARSNGSKAPFPEPSYSREAQSATQSPLTALYSETYLVQLPAPHLTSSGAWHGCFPSLSLCFLGVDTG